MGRLTNWLGDKLELLSVGAPLRIGPTGMCALGTHARWDPWQVFVFVRVCGDESGTHDDSPVMTLAGYAATLRSWNKFDPKWKRAIRQAGLPGYFHATEHWNTAAGQRFGPMMDKLQRDWLLFGYVIELDKESYERHYIGGNRPRKPQLDTRYSVCFRFLLAFLLTRLPILLGREDITLNFILEDGAAGSADAGRIVQQLRKQPETQDIASMLAPVAVSFGDKKRVPGLQVSDSLAFGALKLAPATENPGVLIDIPQDAPLPDWQSTTQAKPPVAYCRLDETLLGLLKSDILTMVEIRKRIAADAIAARNSG
jgi:hypothetical protein